MKKVNELSIKINRAVITSISVELDLDDNVPVWSVQGKLITDQGTPISDFNFSNRTWANESQKIVIPFGSNALGKELFESFTPVILEKLGNMFKALPAPEEIS